VPLIFYKVWAPAMRAHAKSLGKERFGIFGEFFVSAERYATMTGRGRDNTMYNQDVFIDDISTLKGGIVYPYYWYIFTAMVYKRPEYADGLPLAYTEENKMIDTYDPTTNRHEYAMWTFCNNHDNWRLQSMTGKTEFIMCLAVITFWPGVPLHYAGDEQDFDTPGSALDGWAREELSTSMAWRAVRTRTDGNPADGDNFDMTSATYLYISRLNALRRAYFGDFGVEACDQVQYPTQATPDVLVFLRGCNESKKVLLFANFHTTESRPGMMDAVPWDDGTLLTDCVATDSPTQVTVSSGVVSVSLGPLQALVFVTDVAAVPPSITEVWPKHGSTVDLSPDQANLTVRLRFDRTVPSSLSGSIYFDQVPGGFSCGGDTCTKEVDVASLSNEFHVLEVAEGAGTSDGMGLHAKFRSIFMIDRQEGAVAKPVHEQPGLICNSSQQLCHNANGATWFRAQNIGGNWSAWTPYTNKSTWEAVAGVPVLVQYFSELSASFIVGDCLDENGKPCHASWHTEMFLRGELNNWGGTDEGRMKLILPFTWAANITISKFVQARFTPTNDWSKSYGAHPVRELLYNVPYFDPRHTSFDIVPTKSGSEPCREWMADRSLWTEHETIASGAEFAVNLWLSPLCNAVAPACEPDPQAKWQCHSYQAGQDGAWCASVGSEGCYEYGINDQSEEMSSCDPCYCCKRKVTQAQAAAEATCCVKFNDLFLNYTVTPDLSQCAPVPPVASQLLDVYFTITMEIDNASAFVVRSDEQHASIVAAAVGIAVDNVSIAKTEYGVTATYEFFGIDVGDIQAMQLDLCDAFVSENSSACAASGHPSEVRAEVLTTDLVVATTAKALAQNANGLQTLLANKPWFQSNSSLNLLSAVMLDMRLSVRVVIASSENASDYIPDPAVLTNEFSTEYGHEVVLSVLLPTTTTTSTTATTSTIGTTSSLTTTTTDICVQLLVKSAGSQDGNYAEFYIDGTQIDVAAGRGLSLVKLSDSGRVLETQVFDTGYQANGAGPLAAWVSSISQGTGVMVAAMDDASDNLTAEAKSALKELGATLIDDLAYRGSYALIGVKGGAAVAERLAVSGDGPVEISATNIWNPECAVTSSSHTGSMTLQVRSAGSLDGNFVEFLVNGELLDLAGGRGLNVIVLQEDGQVQEHVFDTGYQGDGSGPLTDLLNGLAAGTAVLVAAMDDATDALTDQAKGAIKDLGATQIDDLAYRGSYALIGIKGGPALAEKVAASGSGPVNVMGTFPPEGSSSSSGQTSSTTPVEESATTTSTVSSGAASTTTTTPGTSSSISGSTANPDVPGTTKSSWEFVDAGGRVRWTATMAVLLMCMLDV